MRQYPEILDHYAEADEQGRLTSAHGLLELCRTQRILQDVLPPVPAVVHDVGGGAGVYALWLASLGYAAHLIDVVPKHIEQARRASDQAEHPLASCNIGDARDLDVASGESDAVLLLGPLYHLPGAEDRKACWREAYRVLRPGGIVIAATISRFASLLDGLSRGLLTDSAFADIVRDDLATGIHNNPTANPDYFTTAYFHRPEEASAGARAAGFDVTDVVAVEGPAWMSPHLQETMNDARRRADLMSFLATVQREPSLLGVTAHLLTCARKP